MRKTIVVILSVLLLFGLAACGGTDSSQTPPASTPPSTPSTSTPSTSTPATPATPQEPAAGGPEYGGIMRITTQASFQEPFGLPWMYQTMNRPLAPFGEGLVLETPYGEITPFLATSWEIDADNLEITFHLRDDVYFSDGSKFNAEAVVWNVEGYIEGKVMNPSVRGAEARGEYDVTMLLRDYNNSLLNIFASRGQALVSKEGYEKNGEDYSLEHPIGTGPFTLKERSPGLRVSFERRDDYWQPGKPYLDGIEYIAMTDPMTQNAAMIAGEIDILQTSAGEQIDTLLKAADVHVQQFPSGPYCLFPDSMNPDSPLAKLEVRQAISYAIDREAVCDARGFGSWTPGVQLIPPPFPGPLPDSYNLSYNPDKAKELLAQAGYPNGIDIKFNAPQAADRDAMIAVQAMLEAVGIRCEMYFPEAGAATDLRNNGWDGLYVAVVQPLANAISSFRLNFDPDFLYFVSTARPDGYTPLYMQARTSLVVEENLVQDLHRMFLDNMVVIPMYNIYTTYLVRNGFNDTGFGEYSAGTQWLPENAWKASK